MKTIRNNSPWILALVGSICLVAAAAVVAQRQPVTTQPIARNAQELSSIFRHVSHEALPSIVSIETISKPVKQSEIALPFDDNSPFGDFFKNNPEFREFFQNRKPGQMPRSRGMGSGFIIDPSGIIMTNNHVVSNADQVKVRLHDGREFVANHIKTDPRSDVAIVRIDAPKDLQAIPLGNSSNIEIGDWVLAVGSPFGLDLSVTAGIISAKERGPGIAERENFLQTDAAINPGNSGGPLLNLNGEVIGINTAISTRSGGYDGIGFAIPINMAKWVSNQLIEKGKVSRAYLGVLIQQVDSNLAKKFKVDVGEGAIISQVLSGSPAEDAKLEPGDVILDLNGKNVKGTRDLQGIVEQLEIDKKYLMTILRNGEKLKIDITLRTMPENLTAATPVGKSDDSSAPAEKNYASLGIEINELTPEIAKQLGYENVSGVVISSVDVDSPAHEAGLRTGDVIEKVGSSKIESTKDFDQAMKMASLKDGILFLVRNQRGTRFVVIEQVK